MKISYRREMKHNYLIVDPEELTWRNYECKMLSGNIIDGVLQFQLRQIDDEIRFYYEITSRQPLSRMLETHAVREPEIRQIILGISRILDRMEQYLLRESCVLLEPDYIYVEPEEFQIWLCLVPGMERDFPYDYGKLLEYLLRKVDHQDKESVILAYGLYQETRKENYGMEDVLRLMLSGRRKQEEEKNPEQETGIAQETKQNVIKELERETYEREQQPKKQSFWARMKEKARRRKCNQKKSTYHPEKITWDPMFRDDLQKERGLSDFVEKCDERQKQGMKKSDDSGRMCDFSTEKIFADAGRNTTLLADLSSDTSQERRLCGLDSGLEDITLRYYPFIIGKQEHLVDHYLNHETVSRLHVRIERTDDGWTIQDLNSSNGTMIAGRLLENNEIAPLHLGDEVRIADLRYRFM
ncbi:MAG: DUF6382 domain-containing protein [Brotaphodocola sp.]